MTIKLIRVDDSAVPLKIKLPVGKHIIGRGSFFNTDNISDYRVSAKHAELEVTNDMLTLKSLHQNPCFYIKKNIDITEILNQNDTLILGNGDKFGMLPEIYWYEVIYSTIDDVDANLESSNAIDENAENADITDYDLSKDNHSSLCMLVKPLGINQDPTQRVFDAQSPSDQTPAIRLDSEDSNEDASRRNDQRGMK